MNTVRIEGPCAFLALRSRNGELTGEAVIDVADLPQLQALGVTWSLNKDHGYVNSAINVSGQRKTVYLHRILLDAPKGLRVDHIDHDPLNNRRTNLRIVTASQNNQNQHHTSRRSSTGIKNVSFCPGRSKPYLVRLQLDKRTLRFGYYQTLEEAERVAIRARKNHFTHAPENLPESA